VLPQKKNAQRTSFELLLHLLKKLGLTSQVVEWLSNDAMTPLLKRSEKPKFYSFCLTKNSYYSKYRDTNHKIFSKSHYPGPGKREKIMMQTNT
jgi:hypothetical protein